jgi:DNA excision repair protein ERCC-4
VARLINKVNASPSDEAGIGDELGIMGVRDPGFRVLNFEMSVTQRSVKHHMHCTVCETS